jgi:hypothetical protein
MAWKTLLVAAAATLSAGAANAATLEIRDAVVRVTVVPEARSDVRVDIIRPNPRLPLSVETFGDHTLVRGDVGRRLRSCPDIGQPHAIGVRGLGRVAWEDIPQVVVHTPRQISIATGGAVFGLIGRSEGLEIRNSGCSRWTIADVAGRVAIHESGAGQIRMGASDQLLLRLSGATDLHATAVRQLTDARLSGAGQVRIDRIAGPLDADVSGVGRIRVEDGRSSQMRASVSGMGQVEFGGAADSLDASISGLGSVRVREVTGPIRKSVTGGGHVSVGERVSAR